MKKFVATLLVAICLKIALFAYYFDAKVDKKIPDLPKKIERIASEEGPAMYMLEYDDKIIFIPEQEGEEK